jgi:hypothetical protein
MNAGWGHGACHALFLVVDEGEAEAIIGRLQLIRGLPHENVWCRVRTGAAQQLHVSTVRPPCVGCLWIHDLYRSWRLSQSRTREINRRA